MTLLERYLDAFSGLCEGGREAPEGIVLKQTSPQARIQELIPQIEALGIPEFLRRCAAQDGEVLSERELAAFDLARLLPPSAPQAPDAPAAAPEAPGAPEASPEAQESGPVKSEIRDIYEVFLDSVCLDDRLLEYLIDILKRGAKDEFQTLSHAAARTLLDMEDFLFWLGHKELLGTERERACVFLMDTALSRLIDEGERELAAALLSGDEQTFKLFRTQAPELLHLPDATYEWYCENYLDRYYPVRFFLRQNGVCFPETEKED